MARFGGAGVEHAGDIGVIHQGQRLTLRLEAGDDLARVHARLDDLDRDVPADGPFLLGHVNHAEATLAQLLQELVRTDQASDAFRQQIADYGLR